MKQRYTLNDQALPSVLNQVYDTGTLLTKQAIFYFSYDLYIYLSYKWVSTYKWESTFYLLGIWGQCFYTKSHGSKKGSVFQT